MPGTRRLFVALDPPEAVRRGIAARAAALRAAAGRAADDVRWVAPRGRRGRARPHLALSPAGPRYEARSRAALGG